MAGYKKEKRYLYKAISQINRNNNNPQLQTEQNDKLKSFENAFQQN